MLTIFDKSKMFLNDLMNQEQVPLCYILRINPTPRDIKVKVSKANPT